MEKKVLCQNCQHYLINTSCSGCATSTINMVKNILQGTEVDVSKGKEEDLSIYKYSCRIVANDPKEYDKVNPVDCPYYFSNAYKLF